MEQLLAVQFLPFVLFPLTFSIVQSGSFVRPGVFQSMEGKILKMMEDNKQLAQRIDGAIQSASQEVTNLRSELSATSRRLAELGACNPVGLENNQQNHHHHHHHLHGFVGGNELLLREESKEGRTGAADPVLHCLVPFPGGYSMQGSPAVGGTPPDGLLQAQTLSDGAKVTVYMREPEAEQAECNQIHIPLSCRMWEFLS
ncbi:Kazrin [Anabarilius grahami]|uniref:Kazrin n=1 Tax=Anabarilius grahami TaxID=495550 RepID=A0A3N0XFP8_ANAGA|nr:Kazrin [Anabarilius grahami]